LGINLIRISHERSAAFEFVVPAAKAEEMYHPETFFRTGTDFVNVE
jgi:hypothetical protein